MRIFIFFYYYFIYFFLLNTQTRNDGGMILFNEIKTPVGASSELLMMSHWVKRFVQTADSSDVYA